MTTMDRWQRYKQLRAETSDTAAVDAFVMSLINDLDILHIALEDILESGDSFRTARRALKEVK
jgi:hypothetical protein